MLLQFGVLVFVISRNTFNFTHSHPIVIIKILIIIALSDKPSQFSDLLPYYIIIIICQVTAQSESPESLSGHTVLIRTNKPEVSCNKFIQTTDVFKEYLLGVLGHMIHSFVIFYMTFCHFCIATDHIILLVKPEIQTFFLS